MAGAGQTALDGFPHRRRCEKPLFPSVMAREARFPAIRPGGEGESIKYHLKAPWRIEKNEPGRIA